MDSHKEAPSVADMLTSQRPTLNPPRAGDPPSEAFSSDILHSLAEVKGYLLVEITCIATEVKAEIAAIESRIRIIEQSMDHVVSVHNTAATLTNKFLHRITDLEIELEDASNRSRCDNLRICGLPETVEEAELEGTLVACFHHSLPDIPEHLWLVDKVHSALSARGPKNSPPRDVMKWHYFKTKEAILWHSRTQDYAHEGNDLQLYQDVALATLPPYKILVFNSPKLAVLLPSMDIPTFLRDLHIHVPEGLHIPSTCAETLSMLPGARDDQHLLPA
ncbi:Hypothetical predicted protein [Pelobates cultripes]|uniref:Uncharacterized protein n=1 Tax=Pelobates cultripes TaxID=61616 RepID=A0AAD1W1F8_PELCU|nr:Hypothetical predicted protein [Pelobates cultripes]